MIPQAMIFTNPPRPIYSMAQGYHYPERNDADLEGATTVKAFLERSCEVLQLLAKMGFPRWKPQVQINHDVLVPQYYGGYYRIFLHP